MEDDKYFRNAKPVKLADLVDNMGVHESIETFLNLETGEIVTVCKDSLEAAEVEEESPAGSEEYDDDDEEMQMARDILNHYENYVALPDSNEIHEYEIMRIFCESLEDGRLREIMCRDIKGRGVFRRFKDNIDYFGITDDWYRFKDEALREIAINWCEQHRIRYIE